MSQKVGKKQCLICGYSKIIHIHHLDGNHDNDDIDNLIPVCANHHQEIHSNNYFEANRIILLEKYDLITVHKAGAKGNISANRKIDWMPMNKILEIGIDETAKLLNISKARVRKHLKRMNYNK